MRLILGVVDIPYGQSTAPARRRGRGSLAPARPPAATSSATTGDVAQILEARYGVMAMFAELHGDEIVDELEEVLRGKLENMMMGAPFDPEAPLFSDGELDGIEQSFRKMLDERELDGRVAGVPTEAALRGVSHRFSRPYVRRGPRPSFIDTGQYQATMRAWTEE